MDLLHLQPIALVIVAVMAVMLLAFIAMFFFPALALSAALRRVSKNLKSLGKNPELASVEAVFRTSRILSELWSEYRESLHAEKSFSAESGGLVQTALKATVPAELVFSTENVVDNTVNVEFFKHLPGVFTGLGIIGTFFGLITGLAAFNVSDNPQLVRDSLNNLMSRVHDAFVISVGAILIAVAITVFEKVLITSLYRLCSRLSQRIDSLFPRGAGEDYLQRLVRSSEGAEKDAKILKDALVHDLELILDRVSANQIKEAGNQAAILQAGIVEGLKAGLDEPMQRLSEVAERIGGNQVDAVNSLLTDTLAHFSAQIRDLFGDQLAGASQMQRETLAALQETLGRVSSLADRLGSVSQDAGKAISDQVAASLAEMENQQQRMMDKMREIFDEMRRDAKVTSSENASEIERTIAALATQVQSIVGILNAQVSEHAQKSDAHLQQLSERFESSNGQLVSGIAGTFSELTTFRTELASTLTSFSRSNSEVIDKMVSSAEALRRASSDFAQAGSETARILENSRSIGADLRDLITRVAGISSLLNTGLVEQKTIRDETGRFVVEFKAIVDAAKRDASLTRDLVDQMAASAASLVTAEQAADKYLASVSEVLSNAFTSFRANVESTLREGNRDFHEQLSSATALLKQQITELGEALESLPSAVG